VSICYEQARDTSPLAQPSQLAVRIIWVLLRHIRITNGGPEIDRKDRNDIEGFRPGIRGGHVTYVFASSLPLSDVCISTE